MFKSKCFSDCRFVVILLSAVVFGTILDIVLQRGLTLILPALVLLIGPIAALWLGVTLVLELQNSSSGFLVRSLGSCSTLCLPLSRGIAKWQKY
ncbi:hypothetical protein CCP4SC76_4260005 [Gammaproteobacteria bacterium]